MIEKQVRELTMEGFAPYGTYSKMINPNSEKIGSEPVEFFRDMCRLNLGGAGIASFSVCRVLKRQFVVDIAEYHSFTGEGILPLDGDTLIHVGAATPENGEVPSEKFEIFRVPAGTFVSLNPGVWHHAPFAYGCDKVNVLIVLPERTYANDCEVYNITEEKQIKIKV